MNTFRYSLRRILNFVCLVGFFVAIILFIIFLPFKTQEPLAAIPDDAAFISVHYNFFGRLPIIVSNNLVQCLIKELYKDQKNTNDMAYLKELQELAKKFSWHTNKIVFAYMNNPAGWICASPLGNYSMLLNTYLSIYGKRIAEPVAHYYGYNIWQLKRDVFQKDNISITFTVAEGMLLVAFSDDKHILRGALLALSGMRRSMDFINNAVQEAAAHYNDFGWVRYGTSPTMGGERVISFGIPHFSTNSLSVRLFFLKTEISGREFFQASNQGSKPSFDDKVTLMNFFGNKPFFFASSRVSEIDKIFQNPDGSMASAHRLKGTSKFYQLFSSISKNPLFAAASDKIYIGLFSDDYAAFYGTFPLMLKFPTLIIGWETGVLPGNSKANFKEQLLAAFDELNRFKGMGLVLDPVSLDFNDGSFIYAIDITSSPVSKWANKECRPAIAVFNNRFLLLSSHLGVLKRLLEKEMTRDVNLAASYRWSKIMQDEQNSVACWIDLAKAGREFQFPLSLYRSFDRKNEHTIQLAQKVLEALQSFKESTIQMRHFSEKGLLELAIDLGGN